MIPLLRSAGTLGMLVVLFAALLSAEQRAGHLSEIDKALISIGEDLAGAEGRYLSPLTMNREYSESPAKKLEKADFYFQRKDYISAGSIYYSLFNGRKERDVIWEEALFKLAETLFLNNNYISASRYYESLLAEKPFSRFQIDALKRLISAAYRLGEYAKAKVYYNQFLDIGYDISRDQDLLYFLGKALFFDGQYDDAARVFTSVQEASTYYPQALYFRGVMELQADRSDQALPLFRQVMTMPPRAYYKFETVRDLATLAIGRLLFEKGDLAGATDHYLKLDHRSSLFGEAYLELCWVYIKREDYEKALESLRLIKYIAPGSIVAPQAQILEGNILIKLRRYGEAMVLFNNIVKEYADVREQMSLLRKNGQAPFSADSLSDESGLSLYSPLVRSLLKDNRKLSHAIRLQEEIKGVETELEQIEKMESRLGNIVQNKNAAAIFPPLKQGTELALSLQNRLVHLRGELLSILAEKAVPGLSASDRDRYRALDQERSAMEQRLKETLPQSSADIEARVTNYATAVLSFEEELHRSMLRVKAIADQIDAIRSYYLKNNTTVDERVLKKLEAEQQQALSLKERMDLFRKDTEEEKNRILLGGDIFSRIIIARDAYSRTLKEQERLLATVTTVATDDRRRWEATSARLQEMSSKVERFVEDLNDVIGGIIDNIRAAFESERMKVEEYKSALLSLKREASEATAMAALTNTERVNKTLDDIILQADLGIIDVAWEKKEEASQNLNRLRTRMAQEIQELYMNLEYLE